jgi:hypothetical protein
MLSIRASNPRDRKSSPGSTLGALATLVAAILIAYVFPPDGEEKAELPHPATRFTQTALTQHVPSLTQIGSCHAISGI